MAKTTSSGEIVLQFVGGSDIESKLIEWFGHSLPVSHVDIVLPDGRLLGARSDTFSVPDPNAPGEDKVIPPGVQIRPADYEPWKYKLRVVIPTTAAIAKKYYDFAYSQVGKPYDTRGLLAAFLTDRDWRNPDQGWWCSELAGRGFEPDVSGLLRYKIATPANKLDPMSLLLVCSVLTKIPGLGNVKELRAIALVK